MKKIFSFFLLAAVLLAWTAPLASAQHSRRLTADEANALLQHTVGSWQVKSLAWQPWQSKFAYSKGKANFSSDDDGCVREKLELVQPDGSVEGTDGVIRYSELNKRFEYVQLDKMGNTTLIMFGEWNPNFSMITFTPAKVKGQYSLNSKMMWQYFFFDDGSFKKVIRTPDGQGNYIIAAEFHCQQPKVAKLKL